MHAARGPGQTPGKFVAYSLRGGNWKSCLQRQVRSSHLNTQIQQGSRSLVLENEDMCIMSRILTRPV